MRSNRVACTSFDTLIEEQLSPKSGCNKEGNKQVTQEHDSRMPSLDTSMFGTHLLALLFQLWWTEVRKITWRQSGHEVDAMRSWSKLATKLTAAFHSYICTHLYKRARSQAVVVWWYVHSSW
jgi:hypothetical protein